MHVKNKVLAVVSIVILFLAGFFLFQGIARQDRVIEEMIRKDEQIINNTVRDIENYSLFVYRIRLKQILDNSPDIRQAFIDRDRDRLYQLTLPVYRDLREENEHFHAWDFNLPDGTVFLRVQKPESHGDNIGDSRKLIQSVHDTGRPSAGYDIGKHGIIYWVAHPVRHEGEYVGAAEFGIPAGNIVEALQERFQTEVAVIVKADRWHKATLIEKGFRHYGEYVLMTYGDSLFEGVPDGYIFNPECDQAVNLDDRDYILHNCAVLEDYRGETIGNILIAQDISHLTAGKRRFILIAVMLTVLLVSFSFAVLYVSFGSLIGRLEDYADENRQARESVESAHRELEGRVRERTADLKEINTALEKEIAMRADVEEALRDSHERLLLVLDGLDANVYVSDMETYDVLFINKAAQTNFGEIVGKKCWQTLQSGQGGPCEFCTNRQLVGTDGKPTGTCTWEFENTDLGKWFIIQDRAIRWVDGRVVRLAIATDITERKLSEEKVRASLREKEVLLKEIHHRVKNNMQIVSSLLNLEAAAAGEDEEGGIFRDSQSRIRAMSLVHEKLYQSGDVANVDLQSYFEELVRSICTLYLADRPGIAISVAAEGIVLGIDTAVLCGLIVNELVTNSLRHAFPHREEGRISISLARNEESPGRAYRLLVQDNGVGMPEGVTSHGAGTLGLQLVEALSEHQLQGRMQMESNGGLRFSVDFSELKYKRRT